MLSSFPSNLSQRVYPRLHRVLAHIQTRPFSLLLNNVDRTSCSLTPVTTAAHSTSDSMTNTENKPLKLVVIGGVAGGASFAARARRLCEKCSITIVEKGADISFANCGIPYYISNEITDRDRLKVHAPDSLSKLLNLSVLTHAEAIDIDREKKLVRVRKTDQTASVNKYEEVFLPYDKLLLSPGASPLKPNIPGIQYDAPSRIFTVRTLQDMDKIKATLVHNQHRVQNIAVIGAGFIGLEMTEALKTLNEQLHQVTLIDALPTVLGATLDEEMAAGVHAELIMKNIKLKTAHTIQAVQMETADKPIMVHVKNTQTNQLDVLPFDVIIMCIGVKPDSEVAERSGIELATYGIKKFIKVNEFQQTNDPHIYAVGDAVLTKDGVMVEEEEGVDNPRKSNVALAGPASRQARLAADHIFRTQQPLQTAGVHASANPPLRPYHGSIGTSIIRIFDLTVGMTGWTEKRLKNEKIPYSSTIVTAMNHAGFFPNAIPLTLKVLWHAHTHKIIGAQIIGDSTSQNSGIDKRIDVLATCIYSGMTIYDLAQLELAYSPPYGASRDILNIAGFNATNQADGLLQSISTNTLVDLLTKYKPEEVQIVDVRPTIVSQTTPLVLADLIATPRDPNPQTFNDYKIINIPYDELRQRCSTELDKNKMTITFCSVGKLAYFSYRLLSSMGFSQLKAHVGGVHVINMGKTHHNNMMVSHPVTSTTTTATTNTTISSPATCSTTTTSTTTTCSLPAASASAASVLPEITIDACGLSCPGPLLRLNEICSAKPGSTTTLQAGQEIVISATDPGFMNDIRAFCTSRQLLLVDLKKNKNVIVARIKKPAAEPMPIPTASASSAVLGSCANPASLQPLNPPPNNQVATRNPNATIIVFSCEMDKVLAAFVLATGAAAMGGKVTMFFTFWGLNAIRRDSSSATTTQATHASGDMMNGEKTLLDSMFGWMMPQGFNALPLSRMDYYGAGSSFMKYRMNSKNLPNLPSLLKDAQKLNVRMVACTMSMDAMGIKGYELIDGVELGGVADYLNASQTSGTNLFI